MSTCPECNADVRIPKDAMVGEIVPCADCGAELEILALEPLSLELAPAVQEDWGE
jgi:alpha-aminoadipate carrier protein LysW